MINRYSTSFSVMEPRHFDEEPKKVAEKKNGITPDARRFGSSNQSSFSRTENMVEPKDGNSPHPPVDGVDLNARERRRQNFANMGATVFGTAGTVVGGLWGQAFASSVGTSRVVSTVGMASTLGLMGGSLGYALGNKAEGIYNYIWRQSGDAPQAPPHNEMVLAPVAPPNLQTNRNPVFQMV